MRAFAEKLLWLMGRDGKWMANFTSEEVKSEKAAITIETVAKKVDGGWSLSGTKSIRLHDRHRRSVSRHRQPGRCRMTAAVYATSSFNATRQERGRAPSGTR